MSLHQWHKRSNKQQFNEVQRFIPKHLSFPVATNSTTQGFEFKTTCPSRCNSRKFDLPNCSLDAAGFVAIKNKVGSHTIEFSQKQAQIRWDIDMRWAINTHVLWITTAKGICRLATKNICTWTSPKSGLNSSSFRDQIAPLGRCWYQWFQATSSWGEDSMDSVSDDAIWAFLIVILGHAII